MPKKGVTVWFFSSLTFVAVLHLIDAISALIFNNEIKLLQLYHFPNEKLQAITPTTYFWISTTATFTLWGITCAIAFESPVEAFLNQVLSEAKTQSTVETQLIDQKSEILDIMNETMEANNEILAQIKDIIYNIRMEVKDIEPLRDSVEKIEAEMSCLRKETKRFEEKRIISNSCSSCGKRLLPEFKVCPYCGESMTQFKPSVITLKDYK